MEKLLTLSALQGICCLWESMDADRKGGKRNQIVANIRCFRGAAMDRQMLLQGGGTA